MKKKFCLGMISMLCFSLAFSQDAATAKKLFEDGNYSEAVLIYKKLIELEPSNSEFYLHAGLCYLRTNIDPQKAAPLLEKAVQSPDVARDTYLDLARAWMYHFNYENARAAIGKYLLTGGKKNTALAELMLRDCDAAEDLMNFPIDVTFENLGPSVNSPYPDYNPYTNSTGSRLIFVSRRPTNIAPKPEFDGYFPSDIFESRFKDEVYETATGVGSHLNTSFDELIVGISSGGDSVFIYIDHIDQYGDVFVSKRSGQNFQRVQKIEGKINSGFIESSATISPDGNSIIFASNRNGGEGGFDLYLARKLPDGTWGKIQNLGNQINTPFDEDFPTFAPNGRNLYFASKGHGGMGGSDLYFTTWDPENNTWSSPQNIGYPVNTPADDRMISFIGDESLAFKADLREGGLGDLDIYQIAFNERLTEPAIFSVHINDPSNVTNPPTPEIKIHNEANELIGLYRPNKTNGRYIFALYPGKYALSIEHEGYKTYDEVLVVNDYHTRQEQNPKVITLKK